VTDLTHAVDEFDLGTLDEAYREAPDRDAPVPDGRYTVNVDRVELKRSQSSGSKMLEWELRILGPSQVGRKLWKYTLLETLENMTWAKRDFQAAGLTLAKLSELPSRLTDLLDQTLEVVVKTKDEFQKIYFRRNGESGGNGGASAGSRPF
jgi:hypothetical protein